MQGLVLPFTHADFPQKKATGKDFGCTGVTGQYCAYSVAVRPAWIRCAGRDWCCSWFVLRHRASASRSCSIAMASSARSSVKVGPSCSNGTTMLWPGHGVHATHRRFLTCRYDGDGHLSLSHALEPPRSCAGVEDARMDVQDASERLARDGEVGREGTGRNLRPARAIPLRGQSRR